LSGTLDTAVRHKAVPTGAVSSSIDPEILKAMRSVLALSGPTPRLPVRRPRRGRRGAPGKLSEADLSKHLAAYPLGALKRNGIPMTVEDRRRRIEHDQRVFISRSALNRRLAKYHRPPSP
jgi:hypothetical protein